MGPTGKGIFLTKGVGKHREKLTSFELALRDARIAEFNLVRVSSIFPPGCKVVSIQDGLKTLTPGQIVYTVMYDNSTDEPHRLIATSVGLAIPADKDQYGYLSEHKSFGQTDEKAGDYAEDLAATMLATALGVDFDPNVSYDERKGVWKLSDKIVQTRNHAVRNRRSRRPVDHGRYGRGIRQSTARQIAAMDIDNSKSASQFSKTSRPSRSRLS